MKQGIVRLEPEERERLKQVVGGGRAAAYHDSATILDSEPGPQVRRTEPRLFNSARGYPKAI